MPCEDRVVRIDIQRPFAGAINQFHGYCKQDRLRVRLWEIGTPVRRV
jgi:hypothetical protein